MSWKTTSGSCSRVVERKLVAAPWSFHAEFHSACYHLQHRLQLVKHVDKLHGANDPQKLEEA